MSIRLTKRGISIKGFQLSSIEIEQQVMTDICTYNNHYASRYSNVPSVPIDIESFVKEMWSIDVVYDDIPQPEGEEILGYFEPEHNRIVVDPRVCNNPRRMSYTIAHEAGHVSLHKFMYILKDGKIVGSRQVKHHEDKNIERQAEMYAASLLAPKYEIHEFLKEKGLVFNGVLLNPVDLNVMSPVFQESFGLSRMALEIRLSHLGIDMINRRYP